MPQKIFRHGKSTAQIPIQRPRRARVPALPWRPCPHYTSRADVRESAPAGCAALQPRARGSWRKNRRAGRSSDPGSVRMALRYGCRCDPAAARKSGCGSFAPATSSSGTRAADRRESRTDTDAFPFGHLTMKAKRVPYPNGFISLQRTSKEAHTIGDHIRKVRVERRQY